MAQRNEEDKEVSKVSYLCVTQCLLCDFCAMDLYD